MYRCTSFTIPGAFAHHRDRRRARRRGPSDVMLGIASVLALLLLLVWALM